jgi:hypothetical protein
MRIVVVILLLVFLVGCAHRYKITLTNNNVITTTSRPRLNEEKSAYHFKDALGRETSLPVFRIKEIEPL